MLTADALFRDTANAAAAAWQRQPPYIAYKVDVTVDVSAMKRHENVSRAVEVRTRDDAAVLQDLPQGQNQLGHAFPIIPTFDALSYFRLDFRFGDPLRGRNPVTAVTMLKPLTFAPATASNPDVTVVTTTLRNYYATYADDTNDRTAHIVMKALPALTRGNDSDFYLQDVYVDLPSGLPTRVTYHGPETDFAVDYFSQENHWLIGHASYRRTLVAPLHIGQTTVITEARYHDFSFPQQPVDPRLREP